MGLSVRADGTASLSNQQRPSIAPIALVIAAVGVSCVAKSPRGRGADAAETASLSLRTAFAALAPLGRLPWSHADICGFGQ